MRSGSCRDEPRCHRHVAARAERQPGAAAEVEEIRSRSWVSGTFVGARHELVLRLHGGEAAPVADMFLDGLEEREFALRGHFFADICLVSRDEIADGGVRLRLEALTVESD